MAPWWIDTERMRAHRGGEIDRPVSSGSSQVSPSYCWRGALDYRVAFVQCAPTQCAGQ